ncbi:MAG: nickel pincer cofactor biosynthesis protein LarB [Solirubrobacterales bacterium]
MTVDLAGTRRDEVQLDGTRAERIGFGEAVLAGPKSVEQLVAVLRQADDLDLRLLLTRLGEEQYVGLPPALRDRLDYESSSCTAYFGAPAPIGAKVEVGVVTGGTSDVGVAREAVRTLRFHGRGALEVYDVGVAGLWRLQRRVEELAALPVLIAVAGMDAALPTVLAGLVPSVVIAVPTSVGYGVADGGQAALRSLLASCAPGLLTVNIDNGFGAACAAIRVLQAGGGDDGSS